MKYFFFSYLSGVDGYRVWYDNNKKCIISRDVIFEKDVIFTQVCSKDSINSPSLTKQVCNEVEWWNMHKTNPVEMHRWSEESLSDEKWHSQKNIEIVIDIMSPKPSRLVNDYSIAINWVHSDKMALGILNLLMYYM